jgi:ABC-type dipeptide/oligopeptide/nickel transport system ATPase component
MDNNSDLINFYQLEAVEALQPKTHNPNYHQHGIKVPFRMVIVGASGAGKSNITLNIISKMQNTFHKIYLYTRNKHEPLYQYLELAITEPDMLEVHEGLDHLRQLDMNKHYFGQTLVIFDDLCNEKDQSKINELFIRGRKLGDGVSLIYLTQKYSLVPTVVREQCNYLILKKISGKRDILAILRNASLGAEKEELLAMYEFCVSGNNMLSFLMIDFNAKPEHQFRHNFLKVLNIEHFK